MSKRQILNIIIKGECEYLIIRTISDLKKKNVHYDCL